MNLIQQTSTFAALFIFTKHFMRHVRRKPVSKLRKIEKLIKFLINQLIHDRQMVENLKLFVVETLLEFVI